MHAAQSYVMGYTGESLAALAGSVTSPEAGHLHKQKISASGTGKRFVERTPLKSEMFIIITGISMP
jgi:hypothetical protein